MTSGATAGYVLTSDASGNASWQASTGGGGVSIDPYNNVGSTGTSFNWNVSGLSTNYEVTLTANTTLNLSNVRNGEYLPNYIGPGSDIHNAPSNANFPLVSDTYNLQWTFDCDAGDENEIGGFLLKLDGLSAFI